MKRTSFLNSSWFALGLTLVLIAIPGIIGVFLLIDAPSVPYFWTWIIALGIIGFAFGFTFVLYRLKVFDLAAFNFNMPLAFVIGSLYVTINLEWWIVMIVVVAMIFTALPANMLTTKYATYLSNKNQVAKPAEKSYDKM